VILERKFHEQIMLRLLSSKSSVVAQTIGYGIKILTCFKYQIEENGQNLQVAFSININKSMLSASYYSELKELFKNAIEKQTEKVVLSKIINDGTTESPGKGR